MVPLSEELRMFPDVPTDTNLLFPKVTPHRLLDVEVMMVPAVPKATNFTPELEENVSLSEGVSSEMVKEVTVRVLLAFPLESVTINVQLE